MLRFVASYFNKIWDWVKGQWACFCCLKTGHNRWNCTFPFCSVDGCVRPYHPLLNSDNNAIATARRTSSIPHEIINNTNADFAVVTVTKTLTRNRVLLKVLPITLFGTNGHINTYVLLDDGSTLLDAEIAKRIEATGPHTKLSLQGIADSRALNNRSEIMDLKILGEGSSKRWDLLRVLTVEGLCLPSQSVHNNDIIRYP